MRLNDPDAETYGIAVARVVPAVERRLPEGVLANRSAVSHARVRIRPWGPARARWHDAAARVLAGSRPPVVVVVDVRDCYRSITPECVARGLATAGSDRADAEAVIGFLRSLQADGIRGLPVGPDPSAVLANAALLPLDETLLAAEAEWLRWVDDVAVFTDTHRDAVRMLDLVRATLGVLGLALNETKTRILADPEEAAAVLCRGGSRTAAGAGSAVA